MLTRSPQLPQSIPALDYRPDIDGLRAVSILAVLGYHAFSTAVPGGFVGVDIFFVISGFLITRIIAAEVAAKSFSILGFYQRRIRRIFPALILVLAAAYAVGWFVLLPRDFKLLGDNIVGGAGFFANLVQLRAQGYFAPDASTNPLLHLWSLGIEEQFYIFWPLLLVVLTRLRIRVAVISMIAIASLAANLLLVGDHQAMAFYSPVTRAWELLAGALLALAGDSRVPGIRDVSDDIKAGTGLVLIALAVGLLNHSFKYPGWGALLPVAGAALLLDAPGSIVNRRLLSHPAMVSIGLVSYPLYLWHWPILSYLGILRGGSPNLLEIYLAVAAAFALAYATYWLIERPIRRWRFAVTGLATGMTLVAAMGLLVVWGAGFGFRFPPEVSEIANLAADGNSGMRPQCFLETGKVSLQRREQCIETGQGPLVFIWGDSIAAGLYPGLKTAQERHQFRIGQYTVGGCLPILRDKPCAPSNMDTFDALREIRPDILLLHARWGEDTDLQGLRETLASVRSSAARIVIVGPVPYWKRGLPFLLVNTYRRERRLPDRLTSYVSGLATDNVMAQLAREEGVEYISAWKQFCSADGCMTRTGPSAGDVVALDQHHLSNRGSEFLGKAIADQLLPQRSTAATPDHR